MMNARPRTISLSTFAIVAALVTLMLMVAACTPAEDPAASAPTAAVEEASTTSTDDGTGADAERRDRYLKRRRKLVWRAAILPAR